MRRSASPSLSARVESFPVAKRDSAFLSCTIGYSISSKVIASLVRSYSLVVRGDSNVALTVTHGVGLCAMSDYIPVRTPVNHRFWVQILRGEERGERAALQVSAGGGLMAAKCWPEFFSAKEQPQIVPVRTGFHPGLPVSDASDP